MKILNQFYRYCKLKNLIALSFFLSFTFGYQSCKKNDLSGYDIKKHDVTENFFSSKKPLTSQQQIVLNYFFRLNEKSEFVTATSKQIGYPVWDKMIRTKRSTNNSASRGEGLNDDDITLIPFVRDEDTVVNSCILLRTSVEDTSFQYYCDWQYKQIVEPSHTSTVREEFATMFMLLDENVFGYKNFDITDSSIFRTQGHKANKITLQDNAPTNLVNAICTSIIVYYNDCYAPWSTQCSNGCDQCGGCTGFMEWEYCIELGGGDEGGWPTGSGETGPGGGGSGGSNTPPQCPNSISQNNGCGPGWTPQPTFAAPVPSLGNLLNLNNEQKTWLASNINRATEMFNYIEEENTPRRREILSEHVNRMMSNGNYLNFVELHHDDIQTCYYSYLTEVENNLMDPCLKSMVDNITANDGLKSVIFQLYRKSQEIAKFPIKFNYTEVTSLPNDAPAITNDIPLIDTTNGNVLAVTFNVSLNKNQLVGKSKEYISSVVLHEICHALIKVVHMQRTIPIGTQNEEHSEIITSFYFKAIFDALKELYPSASLADMKDLAIGGMKGVLFDANGVLLNNNLTTTITGASGFSGIDITNAYYNTVPAFKDLTKGTICN